ncbi:MAG: GreA/GreB family elongation factor [Gemmatimonadota bacterium]
MLAELKARLEAQIAEFDRELRIDLPKAIATAVAMGDLSENAEYTSALERQEFVRARLGQLMRRQSELSRIDLRDVATDAAGFGSELELEDADGKRETWRLVFPEFTDLGDRMISLASPVGRAMLGRKPGDSVTLDTPGGEEHYTVIEVITLHGEHVSKQMANGKKKKPKRG